MNVTNDERVLFWEFTRKVAAASGHPVKKEDIVVMPLWVGLIRAWISEWVVWIFSRGRKQSNMTVTGVYFSTIHRTLNTGKAKSLLGYRPAVSLDEGIRRGAEWNLANKKKQA